MTKDNLGFQLPSLEELIEPNPLTVSPETPVIDAITCMNQPRSVSPAHNQTENQVTCRSSYLLILEQFRLVGILTERDIVKLSASAIDFKALIVEQVMTRNIITLKKSDFQDIYQVMSILRQHQIRHLPLVDDCGQLLGIIHSEGICRALNPTNLLKLRSVSDVMNINVLQASPNSSVLSLSQLMVEKHHSCVVIVESSDEQAEFSDYICHFSQKHLHLGIPIGIITERDIVQFQILGLDLAKTPAKNVMSSPLVCMKTTDSLLDVQQQMKKLRVRRLVISGDSGKLQGIISYQDMLRVFNTTELYGVISTLKQELNQQTKYLQREIQQRKQGEVMLRKNQQLLELFVRRVPAAIAMVDRQVRYLAISDRWIQDYQLEKKDIISLTHYEVFPELPQRWKQNHQDILTGKTEFLTSEEDSFIRPNGRIDWLRWELYPWHDTKGKIGGLLMLSEVITERKLLEQKLQSSEAQMRAVFEAMTDLILTVDLTENSIQILPTQFSNVSNAEALSKIIEQIHNEVFDGSNSQKYQNLIRKTLRTHQTVNFEFSLKVDSLMYCFSVNISPVSETMTIWVAHNITHRKQMEQSLFAEKELAQVTLKSIGDAVITTDALGIVKYVNPVAERLTGWCTEEAQGKYLTEIFLIVNQFSREPVINPVKMALQQNCIYDLAADTLLIAKDGTEYAIEDSAAPIQNRQGELIGAVMVFHDVTEARSLAHKLSWQATHDPLTGLYNRRKFEQEVDLAIKDSQDNQTHHALCFLDLDRFKIVNDTCGHPAGDELLKQITILLQQRIRVSDIFARLGGDEFGILLTQCPIDTAQQIANQLRQLIYDFRFIWTGKVFNIGVSIGLVVIDSNTINLASLFNTADAACYAAKGKGRNCVYLYHEQDTVIAQQWGERKWIAKINQALENNCSLNTGLPSNSVIDSEINRFCLYAQKIIPIEENSDHSLCEILLRLIDESGKIIVPGAFLAAAERYDLMPAIDRWVVTTFLADYEAYCQLRKEQKLPAPNTTYTINLSGASINSQEFAVFLQAQFDRYSVPPETICFEITETVAISNLDNAVILIENLRKLGCSIALDDFGSGMCSLTYLKNLAVDYLKIDGSFVQNIADDRVDYATVEFFNHISKIMNIKTIAEFVEDDVILQNLQEIGIDYAQGYGIERPQPLTLN